MLTYQELLEAGEDERARGEFIRQAIQQHVAGDAYKTAVMAQKYYDGENPTINEYEKVVYDLHGKAHVDMYTANHKISSKFFGIVVDQEVSYLLGNGVTFADSETKKKLGNDFDEMVQYAGQYAIVDGVSFGFWNLDHLVVFRLTEFVPVYNDETYALSAGIRFWRIGRKHPLRVTLYELDGYTDYIQRGEADMEILKPKRAYKLILRKSAADGTEIAGGENYDGFPIVPLMNNDAMKSEIVGRRNTIDALDLVSSGMVNGVEDGSLIYWVLRNACGMSDLDAVKFLDRIKTTRVVTLDDGQEASSHQLQVPFEGTQATIDMLKRQLYEDFQTFDSSAVTAGNQTATAINASYAPLDLKADKFERQVARFIRGVLKLAGIDDKATMTRNKIVNKNEEVQTLMLAAQALDDEYVTKKVLTLLGDSDEFEEMQKRKIADEFSRFQGGNRKYGGVSEKENPVDSDVLS